ncbi:piggyBac transposable element-derived protein 3 [Nephila pilipes]|uniref:PiggyBac transposable element-derived protein 3 n=1 Tax=Nephila pilipes TaxID=299642 RepID=A0A8X6NXS8_NEPPI|nr:piggyBac transposable element-derived protein 3 [Nephila pilipes]
MDRYMNNLDELSEDGLEYSDDVVDFLPDTINRNRIPNSKIPTEKVFNKMERGLSMEFVGNYNDVEISVTSWKDNKTVIMTSTFAREKPFGKVMRYDKKIKNRVEITRPYVIKEYNKHMHLLDSIITRLTR